MVFSRPFSFLNSLCENLGRTDPFSRAELPRPEPAGFPTPFAPPFFLLCESAYRLGQIALICSPNSVKHFEVLLSTSKVHSFVMANEWYNRPLFFFFVVLYL